jgi:primosomal protein N' (replication factor Y)
MCGLEKIIAEHCPECGSVHVSYKGRGTQKIAEELETPIGEGKVIRMDSDTTQTRESHHRILEEFRKGDVPVLLGTQMVAKGLDFPKVTLVGIINADTALFLPDFRAGERTCQLIIQVAGRAGRSCSPGKVILQTYNPENYSLKTASSGDYEKFTDLELSTRKETGFPPFSRLALVEISSENKEEAISFANETMEYLRKYSPDDTEILGPVDAPITVIKNLYRIHIIIKTPRLSSVRNILRHLNDNCRSGSLNISIDIDPSDFS